MKKTGNYRQALRRIRPALWTVALLSAAVNVLMLTGPIYMLQVYDRVLASGSIPRRSTDDDVAHSAILEELEAVAGGNGVTSRG